MSNMDEVAEQIRSFLATEDRVWSDELTDAATEYAALCREVNDRLRRCSDYLRQGMRSEAVHLARCQPPLLEAVEALHLPNRTEWLRACARNGIPAPPALLTRPSDPLKQELEEAYVRERSLEPLLSRHRLLALAKAPVRDRLEVLGALAARDAGNPCWPQEVRNLEAVRLKEMRSEAKVAYRSKDLAAMSALWEELSGRVWLAEIPDDLKAGLEKAVASLRMRAALGEVREILGRLNASFESRDLEGCAALVAEWQGLVESRKLTLPPELQTRVRPILNWLEAEERRRERERRMEVAQPVLRGGEELLLNETRRRRLIVRGSIVTAVCAGVGLMGYWILRWMHLGH